MYINLIMWMEKIWYLPDPGWCYLPPSIPPSTVPAPAHNQCVQNHSPDFQLPLGCPLDSCQFSPLWRSGLVWPAGHMGWQHRGSWPSPALGCLRGSAVGPLRVWPHEERARPGRHICCPCLIQACDRLSEGPLKSYVRVLVLNVSVFGGRMFRR